MNLRAMAFIVATGILFRTGLAQPDEAAAGAKTVWNGVYSAAQASRGEQLFETNCMQCHGGNFRGGPGTPSLVGAAFQANWGGKPLSELLEIMLTTMPPGQAGSLPDQAYVDILTKLLAENGYPPSETAELIPQSPLLTQVSFPSTPPPRS